MPDPMLTAFQLYESPTHLEPAGLTREWMDQSIDRSAYRCLPLLLANQAGWIIRGSPAITVTWNGGPGLDDVVIEAEHESEDIEAVSHFGTGILTWQLPLIFRTSPGYNLLVRGMPNWWKDGAVTLEGLVETDWSPMTFTVNWKITRVGEPIRFGPEDPLCFITPQRRGELESFAPRLLPIESDAEINAAYESWAAQRREFVNSPRQPPYQGFYMRGTTHAGVAAPEHQTRLHLKPFAAG